jgi:lysophospholipase L1-like esterase
MGDASQASNSERLSARTKWTVLVIGVFVTIAVMLVLAEAAIRVRQTMRYGTAATIEEYYTVDSKIGLRVPIANMAKGHISINSLGFRGPEIQVPKPPGTVRIAFIGASTTWCAEVSGNEYVWPHLVTRSLGRIFPKTRFDYVNGGVPGYTAASSLKNLQFRVSPLRPDVIVIYEGMNDLSGELRDVAAERGVIPNARVQETSWPGRYSLLWNLVEKNLRVIAAQRDMNQDRGRLVIQSDLLGAQYRRDLIELVRAAQREAKLVAIATLSTQARRGQTPDQQAASLSSAIFYMPFITPDGLIASYERYNEIIREVARESGAVLIDGENSIPGDSRHFVDSVHFTDLGSAAMAERVLAVLSPSLRDSGLIALE